MYLRIPPLKIKTMLESNPLKPAMLVEGLAVTIPDTNSTIIQNILIITNILLTVLNSGTNRRGTNGVSTNGDNAGDSHSEGRLGVSVQLVVQ